MKPGDARWWAICKGWAGLTPEERASGWHFCPEFDEDLTQGESRKPDGSCAWCGFNGKRPAEASS